jgi:hypothetical protein
VTAGAAVGSAVLGWGTMAGLGAASAVTAGAAGAAMSVAGRLISATFYHQEIFFSR